MKKKKNLRLCLFLQNIFLFVFLVFLFIIYYENISQWIIVSYGRDFER